MLTEVGAHLAGFQLAGDTFVVRHLVVQGLTLAPNLSLDGAMKKSVLCLALALFICAAKVAAAQTMRGVIVDDLSKVPLPGAVITLLGARGEDVRNPSVRSDSLGRFTLHSGDIGRYRVRVTRIGYQPVTSATISFSYSGQVHEVTMGMSVVATRLGSIVVTGTTRLNNYELLSHVGFDLRRSKGNGKFYDSLHLAQFKRYPTTSVLEDTPGLNLSIAPDPRYGQPVLWMLRGGITKEGIGKCRPVVYIDGFVPVEGSAGMRLEGLGADMIHGIEVYGHWQLPSASLAGEMGETSARVKDKCGLVAVWTKTFVRDQIEKAEARRKAAEQSAAQKRGGERLNRLL